MCCCNSRKMTRSKSKSKSNNKNNQGALLTSLPPSLITQNHTAKAPVKQPFSTIVSRLYEYIALQDILNYVRASPDPFNYLIAMITFTMYLQDLSFELSFAENWRLFRSAWPPRLVAYVQECEPRISTAVARSGYELLWTSVKYHSLNYCIKECFAKQPEGYPSPTRVTYIHNFVDALFRPREGLERALLVATAIVDEIMVKQSLELEKKGIEPMNLTGVGYKFTVESAIAAVSAVHLAALKGATPATTESEGKASKAPTAVVAAPAKLKPRKQRRHPHSNAGFKCLFCGTLGHWLRSCPALTYFLDQGALIKCAATGRICFMTGEPMEMYRKGMRHNPAVQQTLKNALVATLPRRKQLSQAPKRSPTNELIVYHTSIKVLCFFQNHPCVAIIDEDIPFMLVSRTFMVKHKLPYFTKPTSHFNIIPLLRMQPVGWYNAIVINVLGIDGVYLVDVVDVDPGQPDFDVILGTPWAKQVTTQRIYKPGSNTVMLDEFEYPYRTREFECRPESDRA